MVREAEAAMADLYLSMGVWEEQGLQESAVMGEILSHTVPMGVMVEIPQLFLEKEEIQHAEKLLVAEVDLDLMEVPVEMPLHTVN